MDGKTKKKITAMKQKMLMKKEEYDELKRQYENAAVTDIILPSLKKPIITEIKMRTVLGRGAFFEEDDFEHRLDVDVCLDMSDPDVIDMFEILDSTYKYKTFWVKLQRWRNTDGTPYRLTVQFVCEINQDKDAWKIGMENLKTLVVTWADQDTWDRIVTKINERVK